MQRFEVALGIGLVFLVTVNKKSCDGYDDYEYNMILDNFVELSKPISASQMKDITDSSFNFRQTMFSISEEAAKKIINYVRNNN